MTVVLSILLPFQVTHQSLNTVNPNISGQGDYEIMVDFGNKHRTVFCFNKL